MASAGPRAGRDDFPVGKEGTLGHNSHVKLNDSGSPLSRSEYQEGLIVLPQALGQAPERLLAGPALVNDVRGTVGGDVPLPLLLHLNDGLHTGRDRGRKTIKNR